MSVTRLARFVLIVNEYRCLKKCPYLIQHSSTYRFPSLLRCGLIMNIADFQGHFGRTADLATQLFDSSLQNIFKAAHGTDTSGYIADGALSSRPSLRAFDKACIFKGKCGTLGSCL